MQWGLPIKVTEELYYSPLFAMVPQETLKRKVITMGTAVTVLDPLINYTCSKQFSLDVH